MATTTKDAAHTRPVPGYEGLYEISKDGRVFSVGHNWRGYGHRELSQHDDRDGYPRVRLTKDGERSKHRVHKLVLRAFAGPCPDDCNEARHLNGDRKDNRIRNLAWGTTAENAQDRERHGNTSRGETHSRAIKRGLERAGFDVT